LFIINQSENKYLLNFRFLALYYHPDQNTSSSKVEFYEPKDSNKYIEAEYTTNGKDKKIMKIVFPHKDSFLGKMFTGDYISKENGEKLVEKIIIKGKIQNLSISRIKSDIVKSILKIRTEIKNGKSLDSKDIQNIKKKLSLYFHQFYFLARENREEIENAKKIFDDFDKKVTHKKAVWDKFDFKELYLFFDLIYPLYHVSEE